MDWCNITHFQWSLSSSSCSTRLVCHITSITWNKNIIKPWSFEILIIELHHHCSFYCKKYSIRIVVPYFEEWWWLASITCYVVREFVLYHAVFGGFHFFPELGSKYTDIKVNTLSIKKVLSSLKIILMFYDPQSEFSPAHTKVKHRKT